MIQIDTIRQLLRYSDWANQQILRCAAQLSDEQLDRNFDIGRGTLRRTLMHIHAGEQVWHQRSRGQSETPWPDEKEPVSVVTLAERFGRTAAERDAFLDGVRPDELPRTITYRDSLGGLFVASLGEMLMQACLHSMHHRAQAVNILRRLSAAPPELDYMMHVRKPA
ncbi:MAG: DinB family protein [Phycisphaerae bacterium]|nr:DinB family protein [Phycisphaerae bacterium]NUQ45613.1 DinB family protein [Phycisphaerae bacterium]